MKKDYSNWGMIYDDEDEFGLLSKGNSDPHEQYGTTFNMNASLHDNPHYTEKIFDDYQTIFGKKEDGLNYDYSDRIWQWNYDKAEKSSKKAAERFSYHTANYYQEYLSLFFGKSIQLKHIYAGVNVSSGYSYLIFGYKSK
jgi:hypothetical protein